MMEISVKLVMQDVKLVMMKIFVTLASTNITYTLEFVYQNVQ